MLLFTRLFVQLRRSRSPVNIYSPSEYYAHWSGKDTCYSTSKKKKEKTDVIHAIQQSTSFPFSFFMMPFWEKNTFFFDNIIAFRYFLLWNIETWLSLAIIAGHHYSFRVRVYRQKKKGNYFKLVLKVTQHASFNGRNGGVFSIVHVNFYWFETPLLTPSIMDS
jgi:hypothetical protein